MRRPASVLATLIVASFIAWPTAASAQSREAAALEAQETALINAERYQEALPLAQRVLAISEATWGPDNPKTANSVFNVALINQYLGNDADAAALFQRALATYQKALGAEHPSVADATEHIAFLYQKHGHWVDAEPLYERSLAIRQKALGPDHPDVANSLQVLADLYHDLGRNADAERLYKQSLAIREKARLAGHYSARDAANYASALLELGKVYRVEGRVGLAELYLLRSLDVAEKVQPNNPLVVERLVAEPLVRLGSLYTIWGRYSDAEALLQRSLAICEKARGPDDPGAGDTLENLGFLYYMQHRYAEAESAYRRALAIMEKSWGPGRYEDQIALSLEYLANLYYAMQRYQEAEPLYKRALAIYQRAIAPDRLETSRVLNFLGDIYRATKRYGDAEPLIKQALARAEKAGPDSPARNAPLNSLAWLYLDQERYAEALPVAEQLIASGHADSNVALPVLAAAQRSKLISGEKALDDVLKLVQHANQSSAAAAVKDLSTRLAAGSDRLAQLVRQDQDLDAERVALDNAMIAAMSKPPEQRDAAAEKQMDERIVAIVAQRNALQQVFAKEFPDYAALSNPLPVTTGELQALLSDDEALVVFAAAGDSESYVVALTHRSFDWKSIPVGGDALAQEVAKFRRGLDVDMVEDQSYLDSINEKRELFDLGFGHALYTALLGPVEPVIKDKRHLIVVPFGPLTALPFHLLVTETPRVAAPSVNDSVTAENMAPYRDAAWLIKRQAVSVMPSVASLKALRAFGLKERAPKPLVGFGNPVFNVTAFEAAERQRGTRKLASRRRSLGTGSYTDFWQGAEVDRRQLGRSLPQLPETADELEAVAQKLGASSDDIHLGPDASVTTVKRTLLSDYRVVYFATHGLVAGDVKGLGEPSLALTIPSKPSALDTGLLTASEAALLRLNADWVVLSACNTIAGGRPGAEALSGLARAFFYAGTRALLVTHWSVDSDAAARLTTATFDTLSANPGIGRAEGIRRAMLAYLHDTTQPHNAYPAVWGPFSIIGEGAAQ